MKITLVQIKSSENISRNLEKHELYVRNINSDLIIFPECSLSGYNLKKIKHLNKDSYAKIKIALHRMQELCVLENKTIILGMPLLEKGYMFNCACLLKPDGKLSFYKKISLTEEEEDIFHKGKNIFTFTMFDKKFGLIICRDQSNVAVFEKLRKENIEYLVIQSAHYYDPEVLLWKRHKNIAIPITRAIDCGVIILKVNAVGMIDRRLSHGNTLIVDKKGRLLGMLNDFDEGFLNYSTEGKNHETIYSCCR